MSLNVANIVSSIFFILFGTWFLTGALKLPGALDNADVGPAAFPLLLSVFMLLSAVIIMIQTIINIKNNEDRIIKFNRLTRVIGYAALLFLYALCIPKLGYYISTFIVFPILMLIAGEYGWKKIVFISLGFILFAYLFFDTLMGVPLP